jgi:DNA-binding IclR family transcriptional regulator
MSGRREGRQTPARDGGDIHGRLIQSVERALMMLEEVAASPAPLSAAEVARRAGVNRGTAWRLLATLEHYDLVERSPDDGHYRLGYAPTRLAAISRGVPLVRRARPVIEGLATQLDECVYLQVASGGDLIVLDEVRSMRPVQVDLARLKVPLHCGSAGKIFLAFLPQREVEEFLERPLEAFTRRTVTDPVRLREELARARSDRYAVAYQEHLADWGGLTAAVCDAANRAVAYINVTVPSYRYTEAKMRGLVGPLLEAAAELERRVATRGG